EKSVNDLREVRQLINNENVDFSALVFEPVLLILAVAQINPRAIPEADFILNDLTPASIDPSREKRAEAFRAFHVVLDKIVPNPTEQVHLQAGNRRTPNNRGNAHQMRLPAAGSAAIQNLSCPRLKRYVLLRVQIQI